MGVKLKLSFFFKKKIYITLGDQQYENHLVVYSRMMQHLRLNQQTDTCFVIILFVSYKKGSRRR